MADAGRVVGAIACGDEMQKSAKNKIRSDLNAFRIAVKAHSDLKSWSPKNGLGVNLKYFLNLSCVNSPVVPARPEKDFKISRHIAKFVN